MSTFFDITTPSNNCDPCGNINTNVTLPQNTHCDPCGNLNTNVTLPQNTCYNPCPHAHPLDGGSAWSSYISAANSIAWVGKMPQWNGSEFIPVSGGSGGLTYPINQLVFGDGVTSGGITNPYMSFTLNGDTGGEFDTSGTLGLKTSSISTYQTSSAQVNMTANDIGTASLNFQLNGTTDTFHIVGGVNKGIYYAGAASLGLSGSEQGLGIDILNQKFTFGKPSTSFLTIDASINSFLFSTYTGTTAPNSIFLGSEAGQGVTAQKQVSIGYYAGNLAVGAYNANFIGVSAGENATEAYKSNFIGHRTGNNATNAYYSNFIGRYVGTGATNANKSVFIGHYSGSQSTDAYNSIFLGDYAGSFSAKANNTIAIGKQSAYNDVVDNSNGSSSILIGNGTGTNGFSDSIALGTNSINTKTNQFMVGDTYLNWRIRGLEYIMPSAYGIAAGYVLTDTNGAGTLAWTSMPSGTVTSVGLALPSEFNVTNSPVTSSGTLTGGWVTQNQNIVFASPNGSSGTPSFRALVAGDIPLLNYQEPISLTTIGSSGAATFISNILNIPDYSSSLSGYVPYTGATGDVDLGTNDLNAEGLKVTGVNGNGHLTMRWQSTDPTSSGNHTTFFANSVGDLKYKIDGQFYTTFSTSANTANRVYTFPNRNLTIDNITTSTTSNGTGFIKSNGTNITFDNSTYLTTAITSLNGLTAATQTFANDTNVTITSATSTHTLGWSGTLSGTRGGTGVNNGSNTITIAGNLAFTGANNISFTTTGAYTYTLPSATSTLLQTSSELTVSFGATTSNLTIPSAGGGYPFHTQLYRAAKVGGFGLVINVVERVANTWDILGMYSEANYVLGYKSGSTYSNYLYMVGGAAPYGYIGYATTNPTATDSIGSRIFLAVNGGISISSVAGGLISNTALPAIYCSTGKGVAAGDLFLSARNTGNGTSTGSEVHLVTNALKRVTVFYNGQTEFLGATQHNYVTKSANYTLTDLDHTVEFTAAATATLPDIVTSTASIFKNSGRIYMIVNNSASSVTISRNTAGQIWNQGTAANTFTLTTNKTAIIQAGVGTDYRILSVY